MKKVYFLIITLFAISCNDQLDLYPETNLTEGNYYNTEEELLLAANDAYRQICRIYNANGIPDLFGERFSDNVCVIFTDGANTYTEDIVLHQIKSDNGTILTAWRTLYNAIAIMNDVLEKLENTSVQFSSDELLSRTKAEVLFVRSLAYYNLTQAFGGVPLPCRVVRKLVRADCRHSCRSLRRRRGARAHVDARHEQRRLLQGGPSHDHRPGEQKRDLDCGVRQGHDEGRQGCSACVARGRASAPSSDFDDVACIRLGRTSPCHGSRCWFGRAECHWRRRLGRHGDGHGALRRFRPSLLRACLPRW